MSEVHQPSPHYDWWQANPSEHVALPIVLGCIYDEGQECYWMSQRSYESEEMFAVAEEYYRKTFPLLFGELSALAMSKASSPQIFNDTEATMKHYYRGAFIALRSLEASMPEGRVIDITPAYSETIASLDMVELEWWLLTMRASTVRQTQQMHGFIESEYTWLSEPYHHKDAMHKGARHAYILAAHHLGCITREQELAWMVRDEESLLGWLSYREKDV